MIHAIILLFPIGLFSVLMSLNLQPRFCQYCVINPWLGRWESIKQSKDAAGVEIYMDICCEMALSSTLALLGQQTHQAFPISCWFITGIAVTLLLNEKLWGYNELLSPWSFMFLWRQGSRRDWLGGAVNHESRPVQLISWTVWFHTSSLLNCEAANNLAEVKRRDWKQLHSLCFPSVQLCGRGWAAASRRWIGGSKRPTERKRRWTAGRGREKCMVAHIASDRVTDEGWGYFPQWANLERLTVAPF